MNLTQRDVPCHCPNSHRGTSAGRGGRIRKARNATSLVSQVLLVSFLSAIGISLFPAVAHSDDEARDVLAAGPTTTTTEHASAPRFLLPDGFSIEQVAGPPLVRYPLFGCFDDEGGLYVAEGTGHSIPGPELLKLNLGKIVRLQDTDGDGRFDKSTVFADGLVFPQGVLWHQGAVYVASHPAIWRLEDTDGDGRADRREEFVARFNFNGNGCDIHGPFLGPDGRIYWTDGRHGYRIDRPDGTHLEGLASRIWRCRTNGRELERIAGGGFDNPVEVAWTRDGEMLGTMDQGAGDCLLHYVEGGVYPEDHPSVKEFIRTGPMLPVAKRYSVELPAALCGTMRFRSDAFGPEFRDTLITTHYMTHKLVRSQLIRDGSTFRAEDTDFLVSSDTHLRLTDVFEDADGTLLAIDMGAWYTYGFLGNVIPRPEMLGAIYRIRRTAAPRIADPRGNTLRLAERSARELVPLLDDPRPAVRDRAIERLAQIGLKGVPELAALLRAGTASVDARSSAVWALCRIDGPEARAATRLALKVPPRSATARSSDEEFAAPMNGAHAAGLHRDPDAAASLIELLKVAHPPLRRRAAEALGRIGRSIAAPALIDVLRGPVDPFLEHSVIYALIQIGDRDALRAGLRDPLPLVRKGSLVALDQMPEGKLTRDEVAPLLGDSDSALQQAALGIIIRRPEWADAAHALLQKWLKDSRLSEEQRQALREYVTSTGADAEVNRLAGSALASGATPKGTRHLLIAAMRQLKANPSPGPWTDGLSAVLADRDATLCWEALDAVRARGWRTFDESIARIAHDRSLSPELRVAALECLAGARQSLNDADFEFLGEQLSEATPPLLRLAAARTLVACNLSRAQMKQVADRCRHVSTMILRLFLPIFTRTNDAEVGTSLVVALESSPAAEALTTAELDRLLKEYPATVKQRAATLREKVAARHRDQAAYLARLTTELGSLRGSADAGKEIFLAPRNNCFGCHRAVGRGGTIGPDLSKIGQFRTKSELLESIVFPSFAITPQYQTHTLSTRDGRVATGLVVRETPDAISLRTTDLSELHFPRANVEELFPSAVSIMPDGLEKTLSRQQLADLLEFLSQQR